MPYKATRILLRSDEQVAGQEGAEDGLPFVNLSKGAFSGIETERFEMITEASEWQSFWTLHQGEAVSLPTVDFLHEMVVVAHLGNRPSSGSDIEIKKIEDEAGSLKINVTEAVLQSDDCAVLTVLTQPHHIVSIAKTTSIPQFIRTEKIVSCTFSP